MMEKVAKMGWQYMLIQYYLITGLSYQIIYPLASYLNFDDTGIIQGQVSWYVSYHWSLIKP